MRSTRRARYVHAGPIAAAIRLVTFVVVGIIVLHILLVLLGANPANQLVETVGDWADGLTGWARDLFTPDGAKARVFVNEGLAVVAYAFLGAAAARAAARL